MIIKIIPMLRVVWGVVIYIMPVKIVPVYYIYMTSVSNLPNASIIVIRGDVWGLDLNVSHFIATIRAVWG